MVQSARTVLCRQVLRGTFSLYALTGFDVQYWTGSTWATVPGGSVSGNNKVWKKITFAPLTTSKIRVLINATVDGWSRVVEVEAWTGNPNTNWLVADHLGTPRIILDQTGTLANLKRHDYLPFGEELFAGTGGRISAMGFIGGDKVRQQFTQYERDTETGLDYAQARYFSATQGRFISTDPLMASANVRLPQSWNRYTYVLNNPLRYIDPFGTEQQDAQDPQQPKPDKNNQLINPDGKPYQLPTEEVKIKIKLPRTPEPLGWGGGWSDGIGPIVGIIAGGGVAAAGAGTSGGSIAGGAAGAGATGGGQGNGGQGNQGDNSNNPQDYPTIDPFEVRFTQNSISNTFQNGITIDQLAEGLKDGSVPPNAIPPIRVVAVGAEGGKLKLFTLDNRRLEAFRRANVKIPYVAVPPHTVVREFLSKFTTKNFGTSIRVRKGRG